MQRNYVKQLVHSHLTQYPGMQPEDCIKLIHQSIMGPGHLVEDIASFSQALEEELRLPGLITAQPTAPEEIGTSFSRVYLSGFDKGPQLATFARLCQLSAQTREGQAALRASALQSALRTLRDMAQTGELPYPQEEVELLLDQYILAGCPPVHHSVRYKGLYHPHYRVLTRQLAFYLPVFAAVDTALRQKSHVLVGIDGMAAAGKSTLANLLQSVYGCGIVHTDDFFLQPHQRSAARLSLPGGNIDYERLTPIAIKAADDRAFTYERYNCETQTLEELQAVPGGNVTLLEGSYALHPRVGASCDVRVFLTVNPAVQAARIAQRSPELAHRFAAEWLPMENAYFTAFAIRTGCDVALDTTQL